MKAGKALYNFITKETKEQNRSKKVIVLMRAMCLVVLLSLALWDGCIILQPRS